MAKPGGQMKMIFYSEEERASGSLGFEMYLPYNRIERIIR
jgi:hypothetical protein